MTLENPVVRARLVADEKRVISEELATRNEPVTKAVPPKPPVPKGRGAKRRAETTTKRS